MDRIAQGLSNKYIEELNISMYTDKNTAIDNMEKSPVDVIVADESYVLEGTSVIGKSIIIYMTEDKDKTEVNNHKAIFKYQKITDIYNLIVEIFRENKEINNSIETNSNETE